MESVAQPRFRDDISRFSGIWFDLLTDLVNKNVQVFHLVAIEAVTTLAAGKPFYTGHATETIFAQAKAQAATKSLSPRLTDREHEILQLISEGKATKEVAAVLGLSVKTAETHRVNLMRKLQVHSIGELVRYAVRNKIIEA